MITATPFYENTLIPLVEKKRHKLALELLDPATPSNLNAPAAEFNPDIKDLNACKKSLRACFSLDGAIAQTDAFIIGNVAWVIFVNNTPLST